MLYNAIQFVVQREILCGAMCWMMCWMLKCVVCVLYDMVYDAALQRHPIPSYSHSFFSHLIHLFKLCIIPSHIWYSSFFLLCSVQLISLMCSFSSNEKMKNTFWKVHGWASMIAKQAYSLMLPAGLFLHKKYLLVSGYVPICLCAAHKSKLWDSIYYSCSNSSFSFPVLYAVLSYQMNADQWSWEINGMRQVSRLSITTRKTERLPIKESSMRRHIYPLSGFMAHAQTTHICRSTGHG